MQWEEFVEQFYAPIYRYCLQILRSSADAEDLTQETFYKAFKSFDALKSEDRMRYWIYAIARNACIDRKRWWKRMLTKDDVQTEDLSARPSDPDLAMTLGKLVAALPAKQREVFILRHWHGFSTEETASMLSIDNGTVKSHLKRAVDKLKAALDNPAELDNRSGGRAVLTGEQQSYGRTRAK